MVISADAPFQMHIQSHAPGAVLIDWHCMHVFSMPMASFNEEHVWCDAWHMPQYTMHAESHHKRGACGLTV
jgi:hypothetical protein